MNDRYVDDDGTKESSVCDLDFSNKPRSKHESAGQERVCDRRIWSRGDRGLNDSGSAAPGGRPSRRRAIPSTCFASSHRDISLPPAESTGKRCFFRWLLAWLRRRSPGSDGHGMLSGFGASKASSRDPTSAIPRIICVSVFFKGV